MGPTLRDLQRRFAGCLREDTDGGIADALEAGRFSGARSLDVYRNNMLGVLSGALAEIFPACQALIGAESFERAAVAFAHEHPARSPDLNDYGADFPEFLARLPGLGELAYLADTARLEWLCHTAHYAAGDDDAAYTGADAHDPVAVFQALAGVADPAACRMTLARPLFLFESDYPVDRIRALALSDAGDDPGVDLGEGGSCWIVFRREGVVELERIAADRHPVLQALLSGATLADLDALFEDREPDEIVDVFREWITAGWIRGVFEHGEQ